MEKKRPHLNQPETVNRRRTRRKWRRNIRHPRSSLCPFSAPLSTRWISIPGVSIGTSRQLIPSCLEAPGLLRTIKKIDFAK